MNPKKDEENKLYFPTGSDLLDTIVGGGITKGYPAGKIINIVGDKSSGKCVKNAYILNENGLIKIDDIGKQLPYGETEKHQLVSVKKNESKEADKFWKEQVTETIKIKTSNGFEIEGTRDHPILTLDTQCNYVLKKLSELNKNDICIISKGNNFYNENYYKINYIKNNKSTNRIPINIPKIINENIGTLLGYYIADGNIEKTYVVISSRKEYCRKDLQTIIKNEFKININQSQKDKGRNVISNLEFVDFMHYLLDFPKEFTARNKVVPKCILSSPKSVQISFLRSLIDNDGSKNKKANSLDYYTASEELAKQVQLMLLNMSIYSSLNSVNGAYIGKKFYDHIYHTITIGGNDLKLYAKLIGSKKYDFSKSLLLDDNSNRNCDMDSIPYLKNKMINDVDKLRKKLHWSINGRIDEYKGINRFPRYLFAGKINITIPLLKDFIDKFKIFEDLFDINFYKNILKNDYRYVKIRSIEYKKERCDVYDLHVPDGHLFWSNGFISHNTFLLCELLAAAYHKYKNRFKWVFDDCESGFSFNTEQLYGVELMPMVLEDRVKSTTVEDLYCNVRNFAEKLKDNEIGIYGVDSLDGLSSKEGNELADERYNAFKKGKEYDKGSYKMGKAKYLSQEFFPQLSSLIEKKNILLVIISQVRENVDPMSFEKYTRTGGKALDFYCHTVLWLANIHKIKQKDRTIGVTVKAKTTKSKTPRPYREMYMHIYFDYGIHNIATNIDFLYGFLTPQGKPIKDAKGQWEGKEINLASIKEFLIENNLEQIYRETVKPKLKVSEVIDWLENNEDTKITEAFHSYFSKIMTRNELIDFIVQNKLEKQLKQKVEDKWEEIEASVKTNLPRKYLDN